MSHVEPEEAACPACGHVDTHGVLRSLNGALLPERVTELLDGSFGRVRCSGCGNIYPHEHRLLYVHYAQRMWVVAQLPSEQPDFAEHERGVEQLFAARFAEAPPPVRSGLQGVRPRLVYGFRFLAEAIRAVECGIEPALLECAKLLLLSRDMPALFPHLPCELCFQGFERVEAATADATESTVLRFTILDGARGEPVGTITGPVELLDEVTVQRAWFVARHRELFERPYVAATRVLFGALPRVVVRRDNPPPG